MDLKKRKIFYKKTKEMTTNQQKSERGGEKWRSRIQRGLGYKTSYSGN